MNFHSDVLFIDGIWFNQNTKTQKCSKYENLCGYCKPPIVIFDSMESFYSNNFLFKVWGVHFPCLLSHISNDYWPATQYFKSLSIFSILHFFQIHSLALWKKVKKLIELCLFSVSSFMQTHQKLFTKYKFSLMAINSSYYFFELFILLFTISMLTEINLSINMLSSSSIYWKHFHEKNSDISLLSASIWQAIKDKYIAAMFSGQNRTLLCQTVLNMLNFIFCPDQ